MPSIDTHSQADQDLFILAEADKIRNDKSRLVRAKTAAEAKAQALLDMADKVIPDKPKRRIVGAVANKVKLRSKNG